MVYLQTIATDEDKSKLEEIYREYRNLMYYIACSRMGHAQDASLSGSTTGFPGSNKTSTAGEGYGKGTLQ